MHPCLFKRITLPIFVNVGRADAMMIIDYDDTWRPIIAALSARQMFGEKKVVKKINLRKELFRFSINWVLSQEIKWWQMWTDG